MIQRTITNPIEDDWHCIACGYSLIGLDPASVCPECGTRLALSLREDGLDHANPIWMTRLTLGVTLLLVYMALDLICELPLYTLLGQSINSTVLQIAMRISTAIEALFFAAAWIIATPPYVVIGRYRYKGWRWTIRITTAIGAICSMVVPLIPYSIGWQIYFLLYITLVILIWLYLRVLARRIPDQTWVDQAMFFVVCMVAVKIMQEMSTSQRLFHFHLPLIAPNVQGVITIATLAFAVYLLVRLSNRLAACAKSAMENYLPEEKEVNPDQADADRARVIDR